MTHYANNGSSTASEWLFGAIRRNPEGLLLLAAGCALLMRTGSQNTRNGNDRNQWQQSMRSTHRGSGIGDTMASARHSAGEYLSDVAEKVGATAESYTSAASEYAGEAMRTVSERSRDFAHQAQSSLEDTTEYVLERQPLAVAIIGLAAGAAAAAAFPSTDLEKRALGPAGERLREAAGDVTERLKEAGTKAGERLMDVAEERGLTREGLKEAARDVSETFSTAMEGKAEGAGREAKSASSRQPGDGSKGGR